PLSVCRPGRFPSLFARWQAAARTILQTLRLAGDSPARRVNIPIAAGGVGLFEGEGITGGGEVLSVRDRDCKPHVVGNGRMSTPAVDPDHFAAMVEQRAS